MTRLSTAFTALHDAWLHERSQWPLWIPIFFGIGVSLYFQLTFEPLIIYGVMATICFCGITLLCYRHAALMWVWGLCALVAAGFSITQIHSTRIVGPKITEELSFTRITGTVTGVTQQKQGKRFLITPDEIEGLEPSMLPRSIRLNINTDSGGVIPGDDISILATLQPPPVAVAPDSYDFSRNAFFDQIGGVGFALSDVTILSRSTSASFFLEVAKIRDAIGTHIDAHLPTLTAGIAKALLIGDTGGINNAAMTDIRNSGLAHLLSISGLHLALVAGLFFFTTRLIFASIPHLALHYPIKTWATICALIGSLAYLFISDMPVPAMRSFLMTALALGAIILDRSLTPLRSIAFAGLLIILFEPNSMMTPSFQMSFGAVIALIAAYQCAQSRFFSHSTSYVKRFMMGILSLLFSSLIAGLATAPFGIYHFNQYSSYGMLSNLLAVPLTSFWVMPWGVLAILLMPLHLENFALIPMGWGIDGVSLIAHTVSALPHAAGYLPSMPPLTFGLLVCGGLWLCLWQTKIRLLAIIPICYAILFTYYTPTPDILLDSRGKLFALKDSHGELVFSSRVHARYTRQTWLRHAGQTTAPRLRDTTDPLIACDDSLCHYRNALIIRDAEAITPNLCTQSPLIINLTPIALQCQPSWTSITLADLAKNGSYTIYLGDHPQIQNVAAATGNRPWTQ